MYGTAARRTAGLARSVNAVGAGISVIAELLSLGEFA
jgi:hypothetical protein